MTMDRPVIGHWYKELDTGALFEVVAWDHRTKATEVQYLDGEIAEFDSEAWAALSLADAAAPEDWRGPYELSDEDGMDPDLPYHPPESGSPLNSIEPDTMLGVEDF